MTTFFHHISLLTRYKEENLQFYTTTLGLRFVKNTVNQDNHRMLHYYYGDYDGSPGTVVTFFVVPLLGHRYDNEHYLAEIGLNIPQNSLDYWQQRLTEKQVLFEKQGRSLVFYDPDQVKLTLTETDLPPLAAQRVVHNEIPSQYQLLGLRFTSFHVPEPAKTSAFFQEFLGWETTGQKIKASDHEYLNLYQTDSTEKSRMGRGSIDHIAFAVKDDAALDALYQKAVLQHWQIEKIISRGYFKSLYIREPGGNRVEFATLGPGFTIDEDLAHLGESFALPPFLADQRAEIEKNIYEEM